MKNVAWAKARLFPICPDLRRALRSCVFLAVFIAVFCLFAVPMGLANALNTMMNTAYQLLVDTALYIMAIAVLAGAISALFTEYGIVELLNRLLSPLMRPLFGMPGAAALGIITTYLSDNPAILTLAEDLEYRRYFKAYQIPALTNLGTSFGMGLIVTTFVLGLGRYFEGGTGLAALCGNLGAVIGAIFSTRLMMAFTSRTLGRQQASCQSEPIPQGTHGKEACRLSGGMRIITTLMNGGKTGVDLGLGIIPGVLIICTLVMMMTNGAPADGIYTGGAYEGIALLPAVAERLECILQPLFGFSSAESIAVPVTALGSAGAALGIIPALIQNELADCGDIAVFTAMCMCWSGYLSTHVSMMDLLGETRFTGKAILSHTLGGIVAGMSAHWFYTFFYLLQ